MGLAGRPADGRGRGGAQLTRSQMGRHLSTRGGTLGEESFSLRGNADRPGKLVCYEQSRGGARRRRRRCVCHATASSLISRCDLHRLLWSKGRKALGRPTSRMGAPSSTPCRISVEGPGLPGGSGAVSYGEVRFS